MKIGGNGAVLLFSGEKNGRSSKVRVKGPDSPHCPAAAEADGCMLVAAAAAANTPGETVVAVEVTTGMLELTESVMTRLAPNWVKIVSIDITAELDELVGAELVGVMLEFGLTELPIETSEVAVAKLVGKLLKLGLIEGPLELETNDEVDEKVVHHAVTRR